MSAEPPRGVNRNRKAAVVGGGVIGAGWAARFLLNGWDVAVLDPDPQAARRIDEVLSNARRSLPALYDKTLPAAGRLSVVDDAAAALSGADWIQENVPERLELKRRTLATIEQHADDRAIVGSSTSGFKPSELVRDARRPQRVVVAHPFNPVYLLPLVELVPSPLTAASVIDDAGAILTSIGMKPLRVRKEIDAHIADRLLEATWREALWLIKDGVCTTAELDDAIRYGFGLRWAQMGLFETYRIAGGEAGMRHFLAQFGPALGWPWSRLTDVPEFDDELIELIARQSDAQSGDRTIRELERLRDDNLVAILRALKRTGSGAGGVIGAHQRALPEPADAAPPATAPPVTATRQIPQSWTDCSGRVNDAHYLEAAAQATQRFLTLIGAAADHSTAAGNYLTIEQRVRYLHELRAGDTLTVTTQVLQSHDETLRLLHRLLGDGDRLCATVESLLRHVDPTTRTASPPPAVRDRLAVYADAHAGLPTPRTEPEGSVENRQL